MSAQHHWTSKTVVGGTVTFMPTNASTVRAFADKSWNGVEWDVVTWDTRRPDVRSIATVTFDEAGFRGRQWTSEFDGQQWPTLWDAVEAAMNAQVAATDIAFEWDRVTAEADVEATEPLQGDWDDFKAHNAVEPTLFDKALDAARDITFRKHVEWNPIPWLVIGLTREEAISIAETIRDEQAQRAGFASFAAITTA